MIPIRDKNTDISNDVTKGKRFQEKIKRLAEEAASQSVESNIDLDEVIAKISQRENLNRLQIQRLVEEGNTLSYNKRYEKLKNSTDRRISFPIASLDGVIKEMGTEAPPEISNPNLATGGKGSGEMTKAASSIEPSYIHHPNGKLKERQEKWMQKVASVKEKETQKKLALQEKEKQSTMFKIANSLVMSERNYKNGNEVFNSLLSDVSLGPEVIEAIVKKASEIGEQMVKLNRAYPNFVVSLKENHTEKVANHVLGEYSLLKKADEDHRVREVKLQPTTDVTDFKQLVALARKLEQESKSEAPKENEVN